MPFSKWAPFVSKLKLASLYKARADTLTKQWKICIRYVPYIVTFEIEEQIRPFSLTCVSPICSKRELVVGVFSQDDEEIVLGVGRIPRPVPQVHSQRVPLLRCQTMDLLVPQPVFTDNEPETRLIFCPCAVEVYDAVLPPLKHLENVSITFIISRFI